ncbi:MAG: DUF6585 family protein [Cyanobacteria bacterium P01_F01_bin.4]
MNLDQIAEDYQLAKLLGTYKRPLLQNPRISLSLAMGIPAMLLGTLMLVVMMLDPTSFDRSKLPYFAVLIIPALAVVYAAYEARQTAQNRQHIFENGLVDVCQGRMRAIRFDEIDEIWQRKIDSSVEGTGTLLVFLATQNENLLAKAKAVNEYRFQTDTGQVLKSVHTEVGDYTKRMVFQRKLPQLTDTYNRGQAIAFSTIRLSHQGLHHQQKVIRWSDLQRFALTLPPSGRLIIKQRGSLKQWLSIPVADIPNFDLFWGLINHLKTTKGQLRLEDIAQN